MKQNQILRNTDPELGNGVDPLDTPCNDINTDFPIIAGSNYLLVCTSAEKQPGKSDESKENLVVTLSNKVTLTSTKGATVEPKQLSLKKYISITPTPKYTNAMIARNVALVAKGLGRGNVKPSEVINDPSILIDGEGMWKVKRQAESAAFPERNELGDPQIKS